MMGAQRRVSSAAPYHSRQTSVSIKRANPTNITTRTRKLRWSIQRRITERPNLFGDEGGVPIAYVRGWGHTHDGKLGASDRDPKTTLGIPECRALI